MASAEVCARCGQPITSDTRVESFVGCRYCRPCLQRNNAERAYPPLPKPDAETLRQWDEEYKRAVHPAFAQILRSTFFPPKP